MTDYRNFQTELKHAPADWWTNNNPVLGPGEPGIEEPATPGGPAQMKIGDLYGTPWNDLPYFGGSSSAITIVNSDYENLNFAGMPQEPALLFINEDDTLDITTQDIPAGAGIPGAGANGLTLVAINSSTGNSGEASSPGASGGLAFSATGTPTANGNTLIYDFVEADLTVLETGALDVTATTSDGTGAAIGGQGGAGTFMFALTDLNCQWQSADGSPVVLTQTDVVSISLRLAVSTVTDTGPSLGNQAAFLPVPWFNTGEQFATLAAGTDVSTFSINQSGTDESYCVGVQMPFYSTNNDALIVYGLQLCVTFSSLADTMGVNGLAAGSETALAAFETGASFTGTAQIDIVRLT